MGRYDRVAEDVLCGHSAGQGQVDDCAGVLDALPVVLRHTGVARCQHNDPSVVLLHHVQHLGALERQRVDERLPGPAVVCGQALGDDLRVRGVDAGRHGGRFLHGLDGPPHGPLLGVQVVVDLVDVDVEVLGACPDLLADLGADVLGALLALSRVVADALHDGDHEVLDLALLVGLRGPEPLGDCQKQPFAAVTPEGYGLGAVVQGPDPAPLPEKDARGMDVFADYGEVFGCVNDSGHWLAPAYY